MGRRRVPWRPGLLLLAIATALLLRPALAALAADHPPPLVAVFPVEVIDTSGEPPNPQWPSRIQTVTRQLAEQLGGTGSYRTIAATPAGPDAQAAFRCAPCWREPARAAGADVAAITVIHKLSTLIASLHLWLVDVDSQKLLRQGAVSLRGDTDEAWRRAMEYLLRRGILDPDPQHRMLSSPFPGG
jgi:hypothetical protein